jgi:hypothetical protein
MSTGTTVWDRVVASMWDADVRSTLICASQPDANVDWVRKATLDALDRPHATAPLRELIADHDVEILLSHLEPVSPGVLEALRLYCDSWVSPGCRWWFRDTHSTLRWPSGVAQQNAVLQMGVPLAHGNPTDVPSPGEERRPRVRIQTGRFRHLASRRLGRLEEAAGFVVREASSSVGWAVAAGAPVQVRQTLQQTPGLTVAVDAPFACALLRVDPWTPVELREQYRLLKRSGVLHDEAVVLMIETESAAPPGHRQARQRYSTRPERAPNGGWGDLLTRLESVSREPWTLKPQVVMWHPEESRMPGLIETTIAKLARHPAAPWTVPGVAGMVALQDIAWQLPRRGTPAPASLLARGITE